MSKYLYLIAVTLLAFWTVGNILLLTKWFVDFLFVAGLIALLFAVMESFIRVWWNMMKNLME